VASNSYNRIVQPVSYAIAAAVLGAIVGYLRGGIGEALILSFAVGSGVALGILGFELWRRYF
jgi:hypothetical protein